MRKTSSLWFSVFVLAIVGSLSFFIFQLVTSKKPITPPKFEQKAAEGAAYLTIIAGRSPWQAGNGCSPFRALPNSVPLNRVALEMKTVSSDLKAYGTIIETYTREGTDRFCKNGNSYPTWNDLTNLKDNYGWVFGTNGKTHRTKAQLSTEAAQQDESVGALAALESHGHDKAWALFAYPNGDEVTSTDPVYSAMQTNVVSRNFAYGRVYTFENGAAARNQRDSMQAPWWQKAKNVFGGKCNDSSSSCYTLQVFGNNRRYTKRSELLDFVNVQANQWATLQFHFFIEGRNGDQTHDNSWDCTDSDPDEHWTTNPELYCWNDFKYALERIPNSVQVVTPDVVATAWGRTPPFGGGGGGGNPPPDVEGTLKPPMRGVVTRDGMAVEAYREQVNGFVVNVRWNQLQPNSQSDGIAHPNPIDQAIEQARSYNNSNPDKPKMQVKARLFTGTEDASNFWANRIGGEPLRIRNENSGRDAYIGRFWLPSYKQAYDNLQQKLAAEYDDDSELRDITISRCMLVFAEPFLKGYAERELLAAGWTRELDFDCQKEAIDAHKVWSTTRSSLTLNPGYHYSEAMDYCREALGSRCVLENNSYRSTNLGSAYATMYNKMKTMGPPIALQTAIPSRIGDWKETLRKAIELGANAVELNSGYRTYDMNELRGFDRQLETNPTCKGSNCDVIIPPEPLGGITGFYYSLTNFNGFIRRVDTTINFDWGEATPGVGDVGSDNFGVVWVGDIVVPQTGTYTFYTQSDEAVQLWIGGNIVVNDIDSHTARETAGQATLTAGQHYPIKISFFELTGPSSMKLLLSGPGLNKQTVPSGYLFPLPPVLN